MIHFQAKVIKSASDYLALLEVKSVEAVKARHDAVGIPQGQGPQFISLRPTTEVFRDLPYHFWIRCDYFQIVVLLIIKIAPKLTFFALIVIK